jgi:hypothetical protein
VGFRDAGGDAAGITREREHLILKRWGYSDVEIAAMDADERTDEIRKAVSCGIPVGPVYAFGPIAPLGKAFERFKHSWGNTLDQSDVECLGVWENDDRAEGI